MFVIIADIVFLKLLSDINALFFLYSKCSSFTAGTSTYTYSYPLSCIQQFVIQGLNNLSSCKSSVHLLKIAGCVLWTVLTFPDAFHSVYQHPLTLWFTSWWSLQSFTDLVIREPWHGSGDWAMWWSLWQKPVMHALPSSYTFSHPSFLRVSCQYYCGNHIILT